MPTAMANTPSMGLRIAWEWKPHPGHDPAKQYRLDFEHGQWWVEELGTGRIWSAVDGPGDEISFEKTDDGEEN